MFKLIMLALVLSLFVACGGSAPRQKLKPLEPFIILSSIADPATNGYKVLIRVDSPITEESVKKAAEIAIEKYKGQFATVTVQSYTSSNTSSPPYAISRYDSTGVTHQFNSQLAPQKIPTH